MASAAAAKKWPRPSQPRLPVADQPEVGLVDQGRGLEGLAGLLLRQPLGGQLAELVVDQRAGAASAALGSPCSMAERMRVTSFIAEGRRGRRSRRLGVHPSPVARIASRLARGMVGLTLD